METKGQSEMFEEAARELETGDDLARFTKLVRHEQAEKLE